LFAADCVSQPPGAKCRRLLGQARNRSEILFENNNGRGWHFRRRAFLSFSYRGFPPVVIWSAMPRYRKPERQRGNDGDQATTLY